MRKQIIYFVFLIIILSAFVQGVEYCNTGEVCSPESGTDSLNDSEVHVHEEGVICVIYFYGEGCSNCAQVKPYLDELEQKYNTEISITKYEIYHNLKNYQLYNDFCNVQSIPIEERGVPFIAIDDEYYMGVSQIKQNLEPKIKEMIAASDYVCPFEGQMACHPIQSNQSNTTDINHIIQNFKPSFSTLSLPLIILTGLIDGINPCAFAVLIFLLTFLLQISSNRRRMIKAGIVYIIAVYITYFLAGIGLLSVIQISGFSGIIVKLAAILAIVAGLINIKDYFWYGKGISLSIPKSRKGIIEKWIHRANIPAALVLGFLVSMFELPCTGGVYLAILAMLANNVTRMKAVYYLLIYNIMFVLPLLVILLLVVKGMSAEQIESWRESKKTWMRLVLGILLVLLGLIMLVGWI